ncbi:hypothetical protein BDW75DRAFT_221162 [Aspergillus navahoensis]
MFFLCQASLRPLCRLPAPPLASLRPLSRPCRSFSQNTSSMDSDWSSDYSDASLPPPKYGPDTRPPEGHELAIPFLYTPLPDELPTGVHMDLLLLYAAYVGNIDRYVRHRDPNHFIKHEFDCVVRGIYHLP